MLSQINSTQKQILNDYNVNPLNSNDYNIEKLLNEFEMKFKIVKG